MPSVRGDYPPLKEAVPQLAALTALTDEYLIKSARDGPGMDRKGVKVIVRKMEEIVGNFDRDEPIELVHWISVLNFIDGQFDVLLGVTNSATCGIPALYVPVKKEDKKKEGEEVKEQDPNAMAVESTHNEGDSSEVAWKLKLEAVSALSEEVINENLSIARSLLRMSCLILATSFNKDAYASSEVSRTLFFETICCSLLLFLISSGFTDILPSNYSTCLHSCKCTTTRSHPWQ